MNELPSRGEILRSWAGARGKRRVPSHVSGGDPLGRAPHCGLRGDLTSEIEPSPLSAGHEPKCALYRKRPRTWVARGPLFMRDNRYLAENGGGGRADIHAESARLVRGDLFLHLCTRLPTHLRFARRRYLLCRPAARSDEMHLSMTSGRGVGGHCLAILVCDDVDQSWSRREFYVDPSGNTLIFEQR